MRQAIEITRYVAAAVMFAALFVNVGQTIETNHPGNRAALAITVAGWTISIAITVGLWIYDAGYKKRKDEEIESAEGQKENKKK